MPKFPPDVEPDGVNAFYLHGAAAGDQTGFSVASAGDVNGDGYVDLIVSAPTADPSGRTDAGVSYVVFGKLSGFNVLSASNLNGQNGFKLSGVAAGDETALRCR